MDKTELENYLKAGEINKKAQKKAKEVLQLGANLLDAVEEIEASILKNNGKLAFPVNLSVNEIAAHFTPPSNCVQSIEDNDLIKVDIGVHVEGFIADAAFSIAFNKKHEKLIQASENALEAGVKKFKAEIELKEIGKVIQKEINSMGFNPIQNLSGHGLGKGVVHAPPTIPNIENNDDRAIEDNSAYAIEPFATDGRGYVREGIQTEILQLEKVKPIRNMHARKILEFIEEEYEFYPFALRQLEKGIKMQEFNLKIGLKELRQKELLKAYPILKEEEGKIVSQAETSLVLFEGKVHRLV
ncbi:MAG: type II methionyl aminopeptidase [Candidatus Diapherotrites archaeon]